MQFSGVLTANFSLRVLINTLAFQVVQVNLINCRSLYLSFEIKMAQTFKPRVGRKNPILIPGVHRFGRSKMYHKRGMNVKRTLTTAQKVRLKN